MWDRPGVVVIDVIVVSLINAFCRAGSAWATMVAHMVEMGDTPTGDVKSDSFLCCVDKIQSAQSPLHQHHSLLRMGPGPVCDKHGGPQGGVPAQLEDAGRALLCRRS